jgi:ABC-type transport system substrate-binding protein
LYITCTVDVNAVWSDGTNITPDDVKATLNIIKETKVNPIIASLLEGSTIETGKDTITFSNTAKDINFLQVLLQPILPAKVIERLDSDNIDGKFSEINGVYSGRFTLASISQDETVGITKITLGKNENYFENEMYIQFLILNLFRDESHFLKNKNSFNIYNDKE